MARGGLLDIEFIAQYKQLMQAHDTPDVLKRNTVAALRALARHDHLKPEDASTLVNAAGLYHDLTQVIRLCMEGAFAPETAPEGLKALITRAGGQTDFDALETKLEETERAVLETFERLSA